MCEGPEEIEASLSRLVAGLEVSSLAGFEAKRLVGVFSRLERLATAAKALCAQRVASVASHELDGHRSAGSWLAAESGESIGSALSLLEAAGQLVGLPELANAFRSGELSGSQAKEVAGAAAVDPSAVTELLDAARTENLEGIRRRCARVRAARACLEDEAESSRRIRLPPASGLERSGRDLPPRRAPDQTGRRQAARCCWERAGQDLRRGTPCRLS
jgi:hypothetical protein